MFEWTKSEADKEIVWLLLKGKAKGLDNLHPQQFEISLEFIFPKIPIETKFSNVNLETCPNWECHK